MDLKKYNVRTDLAFEAINSSDVPNNSINQEEEFRGIKINKTVIDESMSAKINKKPGIYYLIDLFGADIHDTDQNKIGRAHV